MRSDDANWLRSYALYLAWAVALFGAIISLYFGEILQIEPCNLCWYQRIFLFPLVLILGMAAYKNDSYIVKYAMPLALIGGLFAVYHALGQWFPHLLKPALCGQGQECGTPVFSLFGFLSFPLLSAIGFALIALFLFFARKR